MLDLQRLQNIQLHASPRAQRILGSLLLGPSYNMPPRTKIRVEAEENLHRTAAVFAMNHTDRYNYWPFQYWLWREKQRYTATWVKGKYYENKWVGKFMALTNNIPAPSRGYIMTSDFSTTMGRSPSQSEYDGLRSLIAGEEGAGLPSEISSQARNMLGRQFRPDDESYGECVTALLAAMNARFIELNGEAFDKGLDLLIFPQGTRSIRLSKGHIGMVQAALRFKRGIVPIGCNGSDKVYPGGSPWAKGGKITYRIGELMPYESFAEHHLPEGLDPFDPQVAKEHRVTMQGLVDKVMERINDLVDPEYQFGDNHHSDGVGGSRRFV